ncbi:hypothetical protein IWW43_004932 [Coemansia sp. RSA 1935]|nr:hypothetical protein J3F82_004853 [Coemansia sp. RSA 637]KAJ2529389.1 hypothetical protein IWW43_004932 [Coemansia sp. RSA 1935]
MSNSVIDLTDSPPLSTEQASVFAPHTRPDTVVVSSDDERSPIFTGITPLPAGYVLPPIHRIDSHDYGRPERITTLRDILSTRNSRQRGRSMLARQRAGLHFQPGTTPGTLVPHVLPHTGDEPVEAGVYYPIRARAMLPNQRQRQQQQRMVNALPSSVGRTTADGAVDVEDVEEEDEGSVISDTSFIDDTGLDEFIEDGVGVTDYSEEDDEDEGTAPMRPDGAAGQTIIDYLRMRHESQRMMSGFVPHGAQTGAARHARGRPAYVVPFHPGMMPQHVRSNHITPFDFFPGEDISNILSFLEATTPAPPVRPMAPLQPLKLSKRQEELALQPDFSRKVPAANFRDETELPTPDSLEIVCTHCSSSLFDKEPVWAPTCGHTICNSCVDAIAGASRACTACKKRVVKKSLVRLYL